MDSSKPSRNTYSTSSFVSAMREPSWMRKMCPSQPRTGLAGVEVGGAGQCNQKWHIFLFCTCAVSTPGSELTGATWSFWQRQMEHMAGIISGEPPTQGSKKSRWGLLPPQQGEWGYTPSVLWRGQGDRSWPIKKSRVEKKYPSKSAKNSTFLVKICHKMPKIWSRASGKKN